MQFCLCVECFPPLTAAGTASHVQGMKGRGIKQASHGYLHPARRHRRFPTFTPIPLSIVDHCILYSFQSTPPHSPICRLLAMATPQTSR